MAHLRFVVTFLAGVAAAVPSPKSLNSDITILSNNDLQGPGGLGSAFGALYLSRKQSFKEAAESCRALGEELWSPSLNGDNIGAALDQIKARASTENTDRIWIGADGDKKRVFTGSGRLVPSDGLLKLPVLCTQTAPFSNSTFRDNEERWQIQVGSNKEVLTGFRDRLSFRFQGIRYAPKPKRFTYASLYSGSGKTISALEYGSQCVQYGSGSEDCLFLNLWTPRLPPSQSSPKQLKPVMFWIHGGAFTGGTGNDQVVDGANLASRGDVVVVAINYRLSTLGYLALDDGVTNGNFGLADQILALDWVRKNIRDFGGDPENITIFGQSAGAGSVRAMMASPEAVGKFAAAVPMSNLGGLQYGTTYSKYYTIEQEVELVAKPILQATNCANAVSQVDCLREVDAGTLTTLGPVARFLVVDGKYLKTDELQLDGPKLPFRLMMGITAEDGTPFISFKPNVTAQDEEWLTSQGLPYPPRSLFPLPKLQNETLAVYRMGARLATDAMYRCIDQATVHAGLQNGIFDEVYYYEFERTYQMRDWPGLDICEAPVTPGHPNGDPADPVGYLNCHSGELYYVFGNIKRMGMPYRDEKGDAEFEREVVDRWAAFAWGRGPNVPSKTHWSPSVPGKSRLMLLDWPKESVTGFRDLEQCDWLELPLDYYL